MFIGGKFAQPVAAMKFVHQQGFEKTLHKRIVIVQAPSGCILKESLSALLQEEGKIIWLRFGPEDFDPGVCLLSLITVIQRLEQSVGSNTLFQMRRLPGPVQGWPGLYKQLAFEVADSLSNSTALVLENVHYLNYAPSTLILLGRHFLELLPRNFRIILTTQEPLPSRMLVEEPVLLNLHDLNLPQKAVIRLLDENNVSLPVEHIERAVRATRLCCAEGLVGIFQAGNLFGTKYLSRVLKEYDDTFDIFKNIARDVLGVLDESDVHAMAILCTLGYNHPEINQAITGKQTMPPAPWVHMLSQNWVRSCNLWCHPLRSALRQMPSCDKKMPLVLAEHLSHKDFSLEAISMFMDMKAYPQAARSLEKNAFEMISLGQWKLLWHWLVHLPEDVIQSQARLLYASGDMRAMNGEINAAHMSFERAEQKFLLDGDSQGACMSLLAISALTARGGDTKAAILSALQARQIAQGSNLLLEEAWAEFQLGRLSVGDSNIQVATQHFEQAKKLAEQSGNNVVQQYFLNMHSLTQSWQKQQQEQQLQHKHYLETLVAERAYRAQVQHAIHHPAEMDAEILTSQNWMRLPLMLKHDEQIQLQDQPRSGGRRFIWSKHFPGYQYYCKFRAKLDRIFERRPLKPPPEAEQQSPNAIQTIHDCSVGSPSSLVGLTVNSVHIQQTPALQALPSEPENKAKLKQPRVTLAAYLLGSFKLSIDDNPLEHIPAGNSGILLRYLIHNRNRSVPRDELIELFWPEADPEKGRNRLNVIMNKVRMTIRSVTDFEIIMFDTDRYFLNPELSFWADVDEFESNLAKAIQLEKSGDMESAVTLREVAANLYQGDYLQEDIYQEWTVLARERLRLVNLESLYRLSRYYFENMKYASCAALCQSILEHDNCREDVHCLLIRCYSRQGLFHLGLRQYQSCVDILSRELGVEPADSTVALYERLRRREVI